MITIVTDTAASLPASIIDAYQIYLVPQYVVFDQTSYREFFDLSPSDFYRMQAEAAELPKTSAPTVGDFQILFEHILAEAPATTILCIHPSSQISGTVRSARPAAAMFPQADIHIFDTRSVSLGQGMMVVEAARMVRAGAEISAIEAMLADMRDNMHIYFTVDTLDYLRKGGRIGHAAHLVGSMLDLKPLLALVDGTVESYAKCRTRRRALEMLASLAKEQIAGKDGVHLAIIHALCQNEAMQLTDALCASTTPDQFMFGEVGPAVGTHGGPGTIGVAWYVPDHTR